MKWRRLLIMIFEVYSNLIVVESQQRLGFVGGIDNVHLTFLWKEKELPIRNN